MRIKIPHLDLLLTIVVALMNFLWTVVWHEHHLLVALVLSLPLIFVLPGYAFTEVLYNRQPLDGVRRVVLSIGLSIAFDIVGGLILNMFPMGLNSISWSICLSALTTALALLAVLRRGKASRGGLWLTHPPKPRLSFQKCLAMTVLLEIAAGMVILTILFSTSSAQHQKRPGFTQFWLVQSSTSCSVLLGVESFELNTTTYRVVFTVSTNHPTVLPPVTLAPTKMWQTSIALDAMLTGRISMQARLYQVKTPGIVYRNVHLTLYSQKTGGHERQCSA